MYKKHLIHFTSGWLGIPKRHAEVQGEFVAAELRELFGCERTRDRSDPQQHAAISVHLRGFCCVINYWRDE